LKEGETFFLFPKNGEEKAVEGVFNPGDSQFRGLLNAIRFNESLEELFAKDSAFVGKKALKFEKTETATLTTVFQKKRGHETLQEKLRKKGNCRENF